MTQTANLTRVSDNIAQYVLEFFRARQHGVEFHGPELTAYVHGKRPGSLSSPDRVMRSLKKSGELDYEVVSRSRSLYRVLSLGERQQELF